MMAKKIQTLNDILDLAIGTYFNFDNLSYKWDWLGWKSLNAPLLCGANNNNNMKLESERGYESISHCNER